MKSLDLQQIGLQELTTVETRSVDGGNFFEDWVLGHVLDYVIEHWNEFGDSYVPGRYLP